MNTKNKLKKIIQHAIDNGYEDGRNLLNYANVEKHPDYIPINLIDSLIFSHYFTKAYFGERNYDVYTCNTCATMITSAGEELLKELEWKHHIQQLVLLETTEERIDYLYKYLKTNK